MRICFMGTPDFAAASLTALVEAGHELCLVLSQPDKPKNRGMALIPTPVKEYALTHNLPVFQPNRLRDETAIERIRTCRPDMIVVAAYGRILPDELLALPPLGCINVHASLLPKYRGAAPIQWAVLNGETETGITIMHMASELDTGDIIAAARTPIGADETAGELYDRLAALGGALLVQTIAEIEAGRATRTPQNHAEATYAPMLTKALSPVDWSRTAAEIHNQIRGLLPWPAATAELGGVRCKLFSAQVLAAASDKPAGSVFCADRTGLSIVCGGGSVLQINRLQPDGGKPMAAADFLRGRPL